MKWIRNIQILNQLLTYEFDRKLKPDNAVGLPEIHGFCDGGEKAYGPVVFLRWKLANSNYFCVPLMLKAFVAPHIIKQLFGTFSKNDLPMRSAFTSKSTQTV